MRIDWSPLFGYDFFISYKRGRSPDGSSEYATQLKLRLEKADFQCFLDDDDAPVGESLSPAIERGLRRSRAMIVLCTPLAFTSSWVTKEVQSFSMKRQRAIIPVSFANFFESSQRGDSSLASLIPGQRVWLSEDSVETPSDHIIGGIQARFNYRRANALRTWFLAAVTVVLLMISAIAVVQSHLATQQRDEANKQRVEAEHQRNIALARYLASEGLRALHENQNIAGLVLLVESLRIEKTPEAEGGLFAVMTGDPHLSMMRFQLPAEGNSLAFNSTGSVLAAGLTDGTVAIRGLRAGLGPIDKDFVAGKELTRLAGDGTAVSWVAFEDSNLAGLTISGQWLEWSDVSQSAIPRQRAIANQKRSATTEYLALGGRGRIAVVGDYSGPLLLFDAQANMVKNLDQHNCYGDPVALSDNGELLACGECTEHFRGARVYKWRNLQTIGTLPLEFPNCTVSVAFSRRGDIAAVSTDRGAVYLWTIRSELPPTVLEHEPDVYSRSNAGLDVDMLNFSPDGQFLVTRYQGSAYLWHVGSGELVSKLPGDKPTAFAFSEDAHILAIADANANVRLWDLRLESWIDWACRDADRNLTPEEWRRYLPGVKYRATCVPDT
jgi:hypothetical protein